MSGSTQRVGQADTVLLLQAERRDGRVASTKVTFTKLREEPDDYPLPVEYVVKADGVVAVDASRLGTSGPWRSASSRGSRWGRRRRAACERPLRAVTRISTTR